MVAEAQCDACGETNPADSAFCLFCGTYLGWDQRAPAAPDEAPPPSSQPPAPPETASGPTPTPAPPPAPVAPPPAPTARVEPVPARVEDRRRGCPSCGHLNDPDRRFCARCGSVLAPATAAERPSTGGAAPPPAGWWWWSRGDPRERAARRAYRRSLPPLYRWRRVLIGLLTVLVLGTVALFLRGDPVGTVKGVWYDVTDAKRPVEELTAGEVPPGSAVEGSGASGAVDGDPDTSWATAWRGGNDSADGCTSGAAGGLRLRWQGPAEVRELRILAGLARGTERTQQFRPRALAVRHAGTCQRVRVADRPGWQTVELEPLEDAEAMTVTVVDAFDPRNTPAIPRVALREIEVLTRPR